MTITLNVDNYTALHHASKHGDLELVSFFLSISTYPVHEVASNGLTAFQLAIIHKHRHVIYKFIDFFSSISDEDIIQIIDKELVDVLLLVMIKFRVILTPPIIGAIISTNNRSMLQLMINQNLDLTQPMHPTFETPYMLSVCFNNQPAIKHLIDTNQAVLSNLVFLSPTIISHHYEYIRFLVKNKVMIVIDGHPLIDPVIVFIQAFGLQATKELGCTYSSAFHYAVEQNNIWLIDDIFTLFPRHINDPDNKGNTPLMNAKSSFIAAHLIQFGASVQYRNKDGDTALICAARLGNFYLLKLLLNSGLRKQQSNHQSKRAIQYLPATSRFFNKSFQLLL